MASEKVPNHTTSEDQEPLVLSPMEENRKKKFGTLKYRPQYCKYAYELLASSDRAKTKSHVCAYLQCSKPTLLSWMERFPEFGKAIRDGLEEGKAKWREKLRDHAFSPTSEVNNGLIKLLSANVYGIKEEKDVNIKNSGSLKWEVEIKDADNEENEVDSDS